MLLKAWLGDVLGGCPTAALPKRAAAERGPVGCAGSLRCLVLASGNCSTNDEFDAPTFWFVGERSTSASSVLAGALAEFNRSSLVKVPCLGTPAIVLAVSNENSRYQYSEYMLRVIFCQQNTRAMYSDHKEDSKDRGTETRVAQKQAILYMQES
jgi:hypothetical protein